MSLKICLLFSLLYFSLGDDDHCIAKFRICESMIPKSEGNIKNCIQNYGSECALCKKGFAISWDEEECIAFSGNCLYLDKTNKKCETCLNGYTLNKEGSCDLIGSNLCVASDGTNCTKCADYAVLIGNECKLPENPIKGCIRYRAENSCSDCAKGYSGTIDDKCYLNACDDGDEEQIEYCGICEAGYYSSSRTGKCVVLPEGENSGSSKNYLNKMKFSLLLLALFA